MCVECNWRQLYNDCLDLHEQVPVNLVAPSTAARILISLRQRIYRAAHATEADRADLDRINAELTLDRMMRMS